MNEHYTLHAGNNIEVLKQYPNNHFDSIVTDPPYGIDFLGKAWDSDTGSIETYKECLRVLKPGGHLLAFSAARTYHHLAMSVELAGFEIRDQIMWVYSSGFPKSQDVGLSIQRSLGVKKTKTKKNPNKVETIYAAGWQNPGQETIEEVIPTDPVAQQWAGWGTALKPAHEPIVVARKPLKTSVAKNVQIWGTGALNIDATRVGTTGGLAEEECGRFPSNVIGELPEYQKYFYCPKVSRKERHIGYEDPGPRHPGADGGGYQVHNINDEIIVKGNDSVPTQKEMLDEMGGYWIDADGVQQSGGSKEIWLPHLGHIKANGIADIYRDWCKNNDKPVPNTGNNHPTVKPQALMEYLIKLVTPPLGRVLDPFNGSGSTGMAAVKLGHHYTGIDLDEKYIEISDKRISAWNEDDTNFNDLFEEEE